MDFGPLIQALAQKASVTDLVMLVMMGTLIYLLREERQARREDARDMAAAMNKMADAIEKFGTLVTELRIAVAKGDR